MSSNDGAVKIKEQNNKLRIELSQLSEILLDLIEKERQK